MAEEDKEKQPVKASDGESSEKTPKADKPAKEPAEPPKPPKPVKKNPIEDSVKAKFGDSAETRYNIQGELEIIISPDKLGSLCCFIKELKPSYDYLRNVTAVDWKDRLEMVYNVCCTAEKISVVIKCSVDRENPQVESMTAVWPGAEWQEREVYDLMGITFLHHPDHRRILLTEDWVGHPLRKDYVMPE